MGRRGKIARMNHGVRQSLNERLRDGEGGASLLEWLNGLPAVKSVLEEQFGGLAITEQNLSDWRQGGYAEWLARQDIVELAGEMAEHADEVQGAVFGDGEQDFSDGLSALLSAELARATKALLSGQEYPPEQWKRLKQLMMMVNVLRRGDHRARRLRLQNDKWQEEWRAIEEARFEKEHQQKVNAELWKETVAYFKAHRGMGKKQG